MTYTARTFTLPALTGISQKQVDIHLKLYEGYVTHTNLILETISELREQDPQKNAYLMQELRRRLGFEFDGMRMHEYYFEQLEGGPQSVASDCPLMDAAATKYGSWEGFITHIREVAKTRGIGWVITYADPVAKTLHTAWVDDHQLGQLSGLPILLAIDLWEHAYMVDYVPAEKPQYIDAFFQNLNWSVVEARYLSTQN